MRPDKKLMWRRLSCLTECLRKGVADRRTTGEDDGEHRARGLE
jgi:hypothetical protein